MQKNDYIFLVTQNNKGYMLFLASWIGNKNRLKISSIIQQTEYFSSRCLDHSDYSGNAYRTAVSVAKQSFGFFKDCQLFIF